MDGIKNKIIPLLSTLAATGPMALYVAYRDTERYRSIAKVFSTGNILEPMRENRNEVIFFPRDREASVKHLCHVLDPCFTNKYHIVMGEVGTGKTRLLVEKVREKMRTSGARNEGAPVYVLVSQGKSFPDAFAAAINFKFDEHISLKFLLNAIARVEELPKRDEHNKLERVLNALEKAAFIYSKDKGKPAVVIVDGADRLSKHLPKSFELIQEKAKLWADANIVKMVLVSNDEITQELLQKNDSNWSRADVDIYIRDLPHSAAREFMRLKPYSDGIVVCSHHISKDEETRSLQDMPDEHIENIIHFVGGRITHLLEFKFDWIKRVPFEGTLERLIQKELAKFHRPTIADDESHWKILVALFNSPNCICKLDELIDKFRYEDIIQLVHKNIILVERTGHGVIVRFHSRLTSRVVERLLGSPNK